MGLRGSPTRQRTDVLAQLLRAFARGAGAGGHRPLHPAAGGRAKRRLPGRHHPPGSAAGSGDAGSRPTAARVFARRGRWHARGAGRPRARRQRVHGRARGRPARHTAATARRQRQRSAQPGAQPDHCTRAGTVAGLVCGGADAGARRAQAGSGRARIGRCTGLSQGDGGFTVDRSACTGSARRSDLCQPGLLRHGGLQHTRVESGARNPALLAA